MPTILATYPPEGYHGYLRVRLDDGRIVPLHRHVMEEQIGRHLRRGEVVHHVNGDKLDNRPENLELTTNSAHSAEHGQERRREAAVECVCPRCGESFIRRRSYVDFRVKRDQKIYCSRRCSAAAAVGDTRGSGQRKDDVECICAMCKKPFSLRPNIYRMRSSRNATGELCCSRRCGAYMANRSRNKGS